MLFTNYLASWLEVILWKGACVMFNDQQNSHLAHYSIPPKQPIAAYERAK